MKTARHVVTDDQLGLVNRRRWEVERRLMEGTIDPSFVARNLQRIIEGQDVAETPRVSGSPFFADEEVASEYGYPEGYAVKPVCEQLVELSKHFPELDTSSVLACSKETRELPAGAEGWFAVPKWEKVGKTYNDALKTVLTKIAGSRKFYNYRKGNLGPKYLRLSERTSTALEMLGKNQEGDYLLIPAQFGMRHRGRSVRRVRELIGNSSEFGLGSFAVVCMTLAHPEQFIRWEQLHVDCAGDEYAPDADGVFSCAPLFFWSDGEVRFSAYWVDSPSSGPGSASGFLPQF